MAVVYVVLSCDVVLQAAKSLGFPVLYGDGSRVAVLQSAGIPQPKAVLVVYSSRTRSVETVERLHHSFPSVSTLCALCNSCTGAA